MNPYATLGIANAASKDQAKAAYRRLAMSHHPDRGGDANRFKEIQAAWEMIDAGWSAPFQTPSSFSTPKAKTKGPTAGKPAPGYEARGTRPMMPKTTTRGMGRNAEVGVRIELTQDQAFEGCTVPFVHQGMVLDYEVRPGTAARIEKVLFNLEQMIGARPVEPLPITVEVVILNRKSQPDEQTRDAEIVVNLCAIGLFIGGKITVTDHLNERIPILIPAGYDPTTPIAVKEHGYGRVGQRGTLFIKINPVFKLPSELNSNELRQLQQLNEMAKK